MKYLLIGAMIMLSGSVAMASYVDVVKSDYERDGMVDYKCVNDCFNNGSNWDYCVRFCSY